MKRIFISSALLFSLLSIYACKDTGSSDDKNLTKEITFTKEGELKLIKAENDSLIAKLDIEIADDDYQTQTGLMYRNSLGQDEGMLFIFPDEQRRSFYMKNTLIPLDILYFNSEKKLVSLQKNAKPYDETSLPSDANSQYVLEVNAGLADKWKLEEGDKIEFTRNN